MNPVCNNLGSTLLCSEIYDQLPTPPTNFNMKAYLTTLFNFFREEHVLIIERLRCTYLVCNDYTKTQLNMEGCGVPTERHKAIIARYK